MSTLAEAIRRPPGRPLRVLVAEDNIVNHNLILGVLKREGHAVVPAANGREVLAALAGPRFDLILMDVQMPHMDGFEANAAIRAAEKISGRHVPIVAITAHAMLGDREQCMQAGMDDYLTKPLDLAQLRATLEKWSARESTAPALRS